MGGTDEGSLPAPGCVGATSDFLGRHDRRVFRRLRCDFVSGQVKSGGFLSVARSVGVRWEAILRVAVDTMAADEESVASAGVAQQSRQPTIRALSSSTGMRRARDTEMGLLLLLTGGPRQVRPESGNSDGAIGARGARTQSDAGLWTLIRRLPPGLFARVRCGALAIYRQ
jgi:hypothetical protein